MSHSAAARMLPTSLRHTLWTGSGDGRRAQRQSSGPPLNATAESRRGSWVPVSSRDMRDHQKQKCGPREGRCLTDRRGTHHLGGSGSPGARRGQIETPDRSVDRASEWNVGSEWPRRVRAGTMSVDPSAYSATGILRSGIGLWRRPSGCRSSQSWVAWLRAGMRRCS